MLKLTVFVLFNFWCVSASVNGFNESTYASIPPLYGLDEWAQCQNPGDVYCMVDAVLRATEPSPLLTMLEEYSNQTLKHYNRTLIHRGVCVSQCGDVKQSFGPWEHAAQHCINESLRKYGLEAEVLSVEYCSEVESPGSGRADGARALAVLCVGLVAFALLATTLHVLADSCASVHCNKYLLAFSLKRNWEILTYDRSKPRTDDRMKDIACMEGIRVLGMQCVIFSHVLLIYIYSYIDNPQFVEKMYDQLGWQIVLNSPLWLQAFFSLTGFLTAYSVLITADRAQLTFFKCLSSIANRWIRLTPLAGFALWFTISWFPLLGSGPQWAWLVTRESQDCAERWWYHILYIHNYIPLGKFCMGQTWYLAVDMQLHILGMLLLLLFTKCRQAVVPVLLGLVAASGLAAGLVVYIYDLTPIITGQAPETLRLMFGGSKILPLLYLPAWMNLAGYVGGIATAYLLHHINTVGIKLDQKKWFTTLFHLSLTLGSVVVACGALFLQDAGPEASAGAAAAGPGAGAALYAALDRTLVALCFNIFMLGCFTRCKSGLRSVLEWRGFHVLGRLSYCVFLMHFIVLRLTLAGNTQLGHASVYSLITLLITASVLTYVISIPLCLLVELPAVELWKALTTDKEAQRPPTPPTPPPPHPTLKPFDLVSSIRRRQEV